MSNVGNRWGARLVAGAGALIFAIAIVTQATWAQQVTMKLATPTANDP